MIALEDFKPYVIHLVMFPVYLWAVRCVVRVALKEAIKQLKDAGTTITRGNTHGKGQKESS